MLRHVLALGLALSLALNAEASAQLNPIAVREQAAAAAWERGEFAAAAEEAEAGLALSEARDGDGGRTAFLALALAQARLAVGQRRAAVAPARRALALADGDGGVDPLLAEIIAARAELNPRRTRTRARLVAALERGEAIESMQPVTYEAARDLGRWLLGEFHYAEAQTPWAIAIALAPQSDAFDSVEEQADNFINLGIALMMSTGVSEAVAVRPAAANHVMTGASLTGPRAGWESYNHAMRLLSPFVAQDVEEEELTAAERAYARALAWRSMLRSRALSLNIDLPDIEEGVTFAVQQQDGVRTCAARLVAEPAPYYSGVAASQYRVAAVVIRLVTDRAGSTQRADVAASVGDQRFVDAVNRVAARWRIESAEQGAPCSLAMKRFVALSFYLDMR